VESSSSPLLPVLAVFVILMGLGGWLALTLSTLKKKRLASKLAKRGLKAEKDAEKVLKKLGYTLLQRQPPGSYWAVVDGNGSEVKLNADLLVELKGKSYVAEVKTGAAAKFEHAETRRQLLEYRTAFGVDGLLLVDMDTKTVRTVTFPAPKPPAKAIAAKKAFTRWVAIAGVGAAAIWLIARGASHEANAGTHEVDDALEHPKVTADRPRGRSHEE